jgi:protein cornichon
MCKRSNVLVWPEIAAHAFMTFLFLISLNIFEFVLNLPLVGYHAFMCENCLLFIPVCPH